MELKGAAVLVTGGGSGIGEGIALGLAKEGCRVAITGRDEAKLRRVAEGYAGKPPILGHPCDVSKREDVEKLFAWVERELGTLDILVNAAGINVVRRTMAELDPADWERMLATNVSGAFYAMHAALPGMRAKGGGLIVNISSVAGKRALRLAGIGYCASKFAMTALGTAVGLEERPNGIHVTNIYPGEVNTPILAQRPTPVSPERKAEMLQPEDIAQMVVAIAKLPPRALVAEVVMTPLYQEYA